MFNIHFIRVLILLFSCGHVKGKNVTVDTKYGKVQGHVVTLGTGETVVSYLGIPFAKPPVGSLRFKVTTKFYIFKFLNFIFCNYVEQFGLYIFYNCFNFFEIW